MKDWQDFDEDDVDRMVVAGGGATVAALMVLLAVAVVQEVGVGSMFVLIFAAVIFVAVFKFLAKRL